MENNVTPFVIPYKNVPDSDELRITLRSIAKNAKFPHKVILLGDAPSWINPDHVEVVRWQPIRHDIFPSFYNVQEKVHHFILTSEYEDFLLTNDDMVLLKPLTLSKITESTAMGVLPEDFKTDASKKWKDTILLTRRLLLDTNPDATVYNFSTHLPYYYNRVKMLQLFSDYHIGKYCIVNMNTLYFNTFAKKPPKIINQTSKLKKCGLYASTDFETKLYHRENEYHLLNWGASQWNDRLRQYLLKLFPEKSPYEL
ncbi:MAG: hypothetical protein PHR53_02445 [Bacteroidales bacterium]|nr:hypothetical protein [Bacteroidales bacterium]